MPAASYATTNLPIKGDTPSGEEFLAERDNPDNNIPGEAVLGQVVYWILILILLPSTALAMTRSSFRVLMEESILWHSKNKQTTDIYLCF
jgi:hypothetical protein